MVSWRNSVIRQKVKGVIVFSSHATICVEHDCLWDRAERCTDMHPVISIRVQSQEKADEWQMDRALAKLAEEDMDLRVKTDTQNGRTIYGRGELHLEKTVDRLRQE